MVAQLDGDPGRTAFIGDVRDLERNVSSLLQVAGLTEEETLAFRRAYRARVVDWRRRSD
ncbi:MAG: hypothetical protein ACK4K2_08930 [Dehalococcoidia bacterium]